MYNLYDRVLGSLVTAGMGDAMGAPSEAYSREEIIETYGREIDDFFDGSKNTYGLGNDIGEVTDDASQMYEMAKAIISTQGNLTLEAAANALVSWSKGYPKYYPRNCGPTMMHWFEEYAKGTDPVKLGKLGKLYGRGVSNGCAMRVAAAGLCNPGNIDETIKTTITMTKVSHGTQYAYAGACATACAISEAMMPNATIDSVLHASVVGAKQGENIGLKEARKATGLLFLPKLLKAIECVYAADNEDEASVLIERYVGNSGDIRESVPAAIGLFAANLGDPYKTIKAGANIGGDTDTIACIAGMIAGAYGGFSKLPSKMWEVFKNANPLLDMEWAAKELTLIAKKVKIGLSKNKKQIDYT